jgi:hypothetical protein
MAATSSLENARVPIACLIMLLETVVRRVSFVCIVAILNNFVTLFVMLVFPQRPVPLRMIDL